MSKKNQSKFLNVKFCDTLFVNAVLEVRESFNFDNCTHSYIYFPIEKLSEEDIEAIKNYATIKGFSNRTFDETIILFLKDIIWDKCDELLDIDGDWNVEISSPNELTVVRTTEQWGRIQPLGFIDKN